MADTKNYGLKGVGDDVQFGKAGGRFVFNTGASDFRATTDGSTLSHLQVLTPVGDTDAATKLYVDSTAAGLDFKESCVCATTATTGTYNSTGGAAANGQLTSVAAAIDGVTLAEGDRVLIKNHSTAAANGIYVVTSTTTTLDRATDSDSDAEVTAGNFTFIEEGTINADAGFVLQGPDPLTVGTGGGSDMNWVLFSTSSDIIAGTGLLKTGNVIDLDFSQLTSAAVIAGADELIFQDAGVESRITVTNFLADRDIVTATGGNGFLVKTAADTYASVTIAASATANEVGIVVNNGDGDPATTIGLNIQGTTALTDVVATGDSLLLHNAANNGQAIGNYEVTVDQLKTFMNAGTSATSITEGDTTLAVSDTGTDGTLTFTADNVVQFTVDDTTFTTADNLNFSLAGTSSLTIASLTENDVMIVGASGLVEDSAGNLTFNGTTLGVTGAATISTDLTVGESVYVTEQAAAGADTANDGQIWVRDDAPNTLMFTGDTGVDYTVNNVLEIDYEYSSAVTSTDPGVGILKFNSVTIGSITTLYIDDVDNTGRDNSFLLDALSVGDVLTFRSAVDAADYILASVSSVTDSTGFWTIGLTLINTGTIFTAGDPIRIGVEWQSQGVSATPTLITVADSTDTTSFPAFFESATGDLGPKTDASNYTYNATSGNLATTSFNGVALTTGGAATNFLDETGSYSAITLGTGTTGDFVGTITGGTGIDSTGGTTGEDTDHTLSVDLGEVTAVVFDPAVDFMPIIDGGITGTTQKDAWSDIATAIAGSGITATSGVLSADTAGTVTGTGTNNQVSVWTGTSGQDGSATFTWDATTLVVNELSFAGDTISNNTTDQPIIIRPNGTGSIIFQNGSSEEILELNDTASAINGLAITAGATGNPAQITTGTGSEANIDIGFLTNGTGAISVVAGSGNYEDNVTAPDDIPNKQYVDDLVAATGGSGTLDSVTGTVDLTTASTQNIGAAAGIPASCTIMSVTLDVTTASDAVTTVSVGDVTNGAASYMATTENDPEVLDIYIADGRLANAAATRQATATVATAGTVGAATCIITFRHA